jgi:hypothetical protein
MGPHERALCSQKQDVLDPEDSVMELPEDVASSFTAPSWDLGDDLWPVGVRALQLLQESGPLLVVTE